MTAAMPRIVAVYRVRSDAVSIDSRAAAIAVEQSVEMPLSGIDDPHVLADIVGRSHVLQFGARQPNADLPAQQGDRCRYRAIASDGVLHLPGALEVGGIGQPVGNDCGFQGYHGLAFLQGMPNF